MSDQRSLQAGRSKRAPGWGEADEGQAEAVTRPSEADREQPTTTGADVRADGKARPAR
ncbi:hypothetical protein ACFWD1_18675 [Micromonospora chalcea]